MKKFLGKLLGRNPEESALPTYANRSPRVRLPEIDAAVLFTDGREYPIRNLSETGLAIEGQGLPDEFNGQIRVGTDSAEVKLKVMRRRGSDMGLLITDGASGVRGLLRRVFADEFRAMEMTEVDSSRQKIVELGQPKWFYAPGNYELFFVEHEGKILRFEIEWNGQVLVYSNGSVRFGVVDSAALARSDGGHVRSELVMWAQEVLPETRRKALRIVENVSGLEPASRKQLQDLLKD
jgi:hypothetical protein